MLLALLTLKKRFSKVGGREEEEEEEEAPKEKAPGIKVRGKKVFQHSQGGSKSSITTEA